MALVTRLLNTNDNVGYIKRFFTVGVLGTLLDIGLYSLLHILLGVPALAANTVSYSAGIINNYILHRRWTFADRGSKAVHTQFTQFLIVSLSALLLNNLIVLFLAPVLGRFVQPNLADLLAKLAATGVVMCWNFAGNNFWIFAEERKGE